MIASWMGYCVAISALLGLAALSLEHALNRRGLPLRGVWMIALIGSQALAAAPWFRSSPAGPGASPGVPGGEVVAAADATIGRGVPGEAISVLPLRSVQETATTLGPDFFSSRAFDRALLTGWALASVVAVVLLLAAQRRLGRRRRGWRADVIDGVPVLVSKDVGPAVVGFVHSAIVVPEWVGELDADRRRLVLAHETEHLRAADPALLLAAFAFVAVMPWNAPLWWQVRRLRHAVELDCDARVLRGTHDAAAYGELLVDVGEQVSVRRLGLAAFAESSAFLAARIRNLTAPRPRGWRTFAGVTVAVAALVLAVACEAPTPAALDPEGPAGETAVPGGDSPGPNETSLEATTTELDSAGQTVAQVEGASDSVAAEGGEAATQPEPAVESAPRAEAPADNEIELVARSQPNIPNIQELVRLLHPDVSRYGLPVDQALWIAIDLQGRIRESWVGPNLYINFEDVRPQNWLALTEGTPEERQAKDAHQRAVQQVLDANVPGMRVRARWAAYSYRPVPVTLHLLTEAPGTPAWGGRDTLATDVVIRTDLPIAGEKLSAPPEERVSWRGERWTSVGPARVIKTALLENVGEIAGIPIFAETGLADPDVIYRLETEPDVFLPFRRLR